MKLLKVFRDNPNERFIELAADTMRRGGIVIYPTDTLYALGCDALNNNAIEKICKLKGIRSDRTNLSIICSDLSEVAKYARLENANFRLLKENLPGPFTFILPALSKLPKAFKGRKTVGVRIPDNRIALALVEALGNPIMTSSITIDDDDDADYLTEPELIAERFAGDADLVIDGGHGGTEPSTVVDCTTDEPEIVRQGAGVLG
ncbi:MAG: L-threonylcarbamoyladenylate synthase [Muribaculaceae bacterium]